MTDYDFLHLLFKEWIDDPISNSLPTIERREFGIEQGGDYIVQLWREVGITCDGYSPEGSEGQVRVLPSDK